MAPRLLISTPRGAIEKTLLLGGALAVVLATGGADERGVDGAIRRVVFRAPTTHHEISNACTTAQKIDKDSRPPLLGPDGSLPPLS